MCVRAFKRNVLLRTRAPQTTTTTARRRIMRKAETAEHLMRAYVDVGWRDVVRAAYGVCICVRICTLYMQYTSMHIHKYLRSGECVSARECVHDCVYSPLIDGYCRLFKQNEMKYGNFVWIAERTRPTSVYALNRTKYRQKKKKCLWYTINANANCRMPTQLQFNILWELHRRVRAVCGGSRIGKV